ncbi:MAG: CoA-binding protein [Candidatus Helarchaeota archaeon]
MVTEQTAEKSIQDKIKTHYLHDYFFPNSIAIIGASQKLNFGSSFFQAALKHGYKGKVFPVNPKYESVHNMKCYPSLTSIGEPIDMVISCIPAKFVPDLVRECVKTKAKFITVFTSGFAEVGNQKLQDEILDIIRGSNTRIIGPNCLGAHCTKSRITFNGDASWKEGNVSFCSQSGGHASSFLEIGPSRKVFFNFGVSFGNQADLNCVDFLDYYGQDPNTKVIGMYLESFGSASGREYNQKLKEVTKNKCKKVVIWKGGQTEAGQKAAASHTGAIVASMKLWESAIKQHGAVLVRNKTEFMDYLHLSSVLNREPKSNNIGIVFIGGGGSVEMTDVFSTYGFEVPEISSDTQEKLDKILPDVNTSLTNPVDLGATGILVDVYLKVLRIVADDPNVDILITQYSIDRLVKFADAINSPNYPVSFARSFGRLNEKINIPLIFLATIMRDSDVVTRTSLRFTEALHDKNIPTFPSIERAAKSLAYYCRMI